MKGYDHLHNLVNIGTLFFALLLDVVLVRAQLPAERFKRVDYTYDLISGKVNEVKYQEDQPDQFYHKYEYDADNRITHVQTSNNKVLWDMDAKCFYYAHGPLARTEIGDSKVQGIDNVYTLQGWIKGVNSNILDPKNDLGKDALQVTGNDNRDFAKDAFGYSLGYYDSDYSPIYNTIWATVSDRFVAETPASSNLIQARNDLFNGNISSMVTTVIPGTKYKPESQGTSYHYDQLNRIVEMQAYQNLDVAANSWQSGATYQGSYNNIFSYDASGNILKQLRMDYAGGIIDSLTYRYEREAATNDLKRNRLLSVKDNVGSGNFSDDIDDQATLNYKYDELGNLQSDVQEEITSIKWSVYGKIKEIMRKVGSPKSNLKFDYDAAGTRIAKHVYTSTNYWLYSEYYVRDAQGNVLSIYRNELNKDKETISFAQTEKDIYGSSLLGIENTKTELIGISMDEFNYNSIYLKRMLMHKNYQGENHLGNVLAVVSDRKITVSSNGTTIAYYLPDMISANDYYPFGAPMAKRTYSSPSYRFGFNGAEKDDEVKGNGNSHVFTFRVYDPRIGRFLSVDPIGKNYPHATPYGFAENSPIQAIDLEGLEKYKVTGRSFIPMATVPNPNPFGTSSAFAGDNRTSYLLNTTAYRTEQKVNVDFDNKSVNYSSNRANGSQGLDKAGKVIETSEAGTAGPVPTYDKAFLQNGNSVTIHMSVDATNKLVSGAPAINYQFDVTITPSADKKTFDYQISGVTDGFPAYEFWITDETNNKSFLLFNYTPTETGDGPTALFPPMEYNYNLKGNSASKTPATVVPFTDTQNSQQCADDCE